MDLRVARKGVEDNLPLVFGTLCLVIILATLGRRDLWQDEALTVASTNQLLASLELRSFSMGLYYVFMKPWAAISLDPTWLRLPSALAAAGATALTVHLAMRRFDRMVAFWTGAIMVLLFGVTRWGQEARAYAPALLLSVLSWQVFVEILLREDRPRWRLWGLLSAAIVYCHPLGILVPLSQGVALLTERRSVLRSAREAARGLVVLGILLVPMAATRVVGVDPTPSWIQPLGRHSVGEALTIVAGPWWPAHIAAGAAIVAATALAIRHHSDETSPPWAALVLCSWVWVPAAALLAISVADPMFIGRYLIPSLPGVALLLALALARIPSGTVRVAVGLLVLTLLVPGQIRILTHPGDRWSDAIDIIEADLADGRRHGVAQSGAGARQPFEINAAGRPVLEQTVPMLELEPWGTNRRYHALVDVDTLAARAESVDVVWDVVQNMGGAPPATDRLEWLGFCLDEVVADLGRLEVHRFLPCDPP
ncbi:MAG: hypothetical protein ACXIVQ_04375 [Acidimicrobiales bacterium]